MYFRALASRNVIISAVATVLEVKFRVIYRRR